MEFNGIICKHKFLFEYQIYLQISELFESQRQNYKYIYLNNSAKKLKLYGCTFSQSSSENSMVFQKPLPIRQNWTTIGIVNRGNSGLFLIYFTFSSCYDIIFCSIQMQSYQCHFHSMYPRLGQHRTSPLMSMYTQNINLT